MSDTYRVRIRLEILDTNGEPVEMYDLKGRGLVKVAECLSIALNRSNAFATLADTFDDIMQIKEFQKSMVNE